jgi:hypothetical protein
MLYLGVIAKLIFLRNPGHAVVRPPVEGMVYEGCAVVRPPSGR